MSYFSDLHITQQAGGLAAVRAQLTRDFARLGRTPAQASEAANEVLAPRAPFDPATSPMFEMLPVARPVAARLELSPTQAVNTVLIVQETLRPGMTAERLAESTGLPLGTVQVVLEELGIKVASTKVTRLPRDPLMQEAWQQFATAGLMLPHVGRLVLVVGVPLVGLMLAAAWSAQ